MEDNEAKLKLFGILAANPDYDLRTLVQKYGVSIHKLRRWSRMYKEQKEETAIDKLIDMPKVTSNRIIDKVAESVAEDMIKATPKLNLDDDEIKESQELNLDDGGEFVKDTPEELVIDEVTNDVVTQSELLRREKEREDQELLSGTISGTLVNGIHGLKDLKESVAETAMNLVEVINSRVIAIANDGVVTTKINGSTVLPTYTKDVVELSQAICNIQNAFFNKPTTNVNVSADVKVGVLADFRKSLTN